MYLKKLVSGWYIGVYWSQLAGIRASNIWLVLFLFCWFCHLEEEQFYIVQLKPYNSVVQVYLQIFNTKILFIFKILSIIILQNFSLNILTKHIL